MAHGNANPHRSHNKQSAGELRLQEESPIEVLSLDSLNRLSHMVMLCHGPSTMSESQLLPIFPASTSVCFPSGLEILFLRKDIIQKLETDESETIGIVAITVRERRATVEKRRVDS